MSPSRMLTSSLPSNQISPETCAEEPLCRPRMAWLVTDLPEPDSPTMPRIWPRARSNDRPSTALTRPSVVGKCTRRSRTDRNADGTSVSRCSMASCITSSPRRSSGQAHARVDERVEDVDDQVGDDEGDCSNQRDPHDHWQVVLPDRRHRQPAETTQVEDGLGDDGGADQLAEVDAEDGDDRRQRGAQTVPHDDGAPGQALRTRGADEVLTHRLEHARAGEPGVEGCEEERERDPG